MATVLLYFEGMFKAFTFTFLLGILLNSAVINAAICTETLYEMPEASSIAIAQLYGNHVQVGYQIAVTGQFIYKLPDVLKNLNLTLEEVAALAREKVVSVAEGTSSLLPLLLINDVDAYGIDTWYDSTEIPDNESGRKMKDYIIKYRPNLIQGDARNLPLEDNSVRLLLSHMLVNNLPWYRQKLTLSETVRVLQPGRGEARIYGFETDKIETLKEFLKTSFGNSIQYSIEIKTFDFMYNGRRNTPEHVLLTLRKK